MSTPETTPTNEPALPAKWRDPNTVRTVSFAVVAVAAGWYMLLQLAPVLRPLLVAVFLAYVLMPYHSRLRKSVGTPASIGILAGSTTGVLLLLAFLTYASVLALSDDMPRLQKRADELAVSVERLVATNAPWAANDENGKTQQVHVTNVLSNAMRTVLSLAGDTLLEACVVALYLLFLLLEGSRFPDRVRRAYSKDRADEILQIAGQVNSAVVSYLKAKVKSSLLLTVPVGVVLWVIGVKFALLWAILTFLCNFIPYIGSVVAYSLPVSFAFLWFGLHWEPFVAAVALMLLHVGSASVLEPMLIGNAVGVSPLVVLGSLAFWGLLWGIPGMILAVPLTVVAILVMGHFEQTRAISKLLRGD
jgi:AI-2 transport protein TqsA